MKIMIITGKVEKNSGLGRYSLEVIRELRRQGEQVVVASGSGECDLRLEPMSGFMGVLKNVFRLRAAARHVEAVHALDAWPYAIYGWISVLGRRQALYISGVGTYSLPPVKKSMKRSLLVRAYKSARHVFTISRYTQQRICERLPFPIPATVVHMGLSLLPLPSPESIERVRQKYEISDQSRVVLTIGEIKNRKGQLDTAHAVIRLRAKSSNLVYVVVGSDRDATYVAHIRAEARAEGASDCCHIITDAKSDQDIAALYSIADVFVLASNNDGDHFEGFGLVFLEAGQFGVPGVGTKGCGIEDAIIDGNTGILVPQHSPTAIAAAIAKILENREAFSAAARIFSQKFEWKKTVEAYRSVYYS